VFDDSTFLLAIVARSSKKVQRRNLSRAKESQDLLRRESFVWIRPKLAHALFRVSAKMIHNGPSAHCSTATWRQTRAITC
jgi:hypothetical protein